MRKRELMTAADVRGAWAIMPTPAKAGSDDWRAADTVDLDETARAAFRVHLVAHSMGSLIDEQHYGMIQANAQRGPLVSLKGLCCSCITFLASKVTSIGFSCAIVRRSYPNDV